MAAPRLTAREIAKLGPGRYSDGGRAGFGLYLTIEPGTRGGVRRRWAQRIRIAGQVTNLGLGSYPTVTLTEARERAIANKQAALLGHDPRRNGLLLAGLAGQPLMAAPAVPSPVAVTPTPTLRECVERYIGLLEFKAGSRTEFKWRQTFTNHAAALMDRPVNAITRADVAEALERVIDRPSTLKELRQRLGAVIGWAVSHDYRQDDPVAAAVRGLPKRNGNGKNMDSVPHAKVGAAVSKIRADSVAREKTKLALEFLILTATRSGETRGATWGEIDRETATWSIPGERTKTGNAQRVALSPAALDVLDRAAQHSDSTDPDALIWPAKTGRVMGESTLPILCKRAEVGGTPHGFRASFRSWAADHGVRRELAEAALGHVVGGVEGRYQRSDLLEGRREIMSRWAEYITG